MAAGTQGIRAGKAYVELFADNSKLVRGLRLAEKKVKAFGERIGQLGQKLLKVSSLVALPLAAGRPSGVRPCPLRTGSAGLGRLG